MGRSGRLGLLSSLALAAVALAAAPLRAGILNVPGDSPTIQGAIDIASSGDTILVAPGTYVETVNFLGKQLVIEGTGGAAVTTIDGAGGGTAVTITPALQGISELRGLTITGGTGTQFSSSFAGGGGVLVGPNAHVVLTDCVITGNTVAGGAFQNYGGGLMLRSTGAHATLIDCTLSDNSANFGGAIGGTGFGALDMTGCSVVGNTTGEDGAVNPNQGNGKISSCVFAGNSGDGLRWTGYGMTVENCDFFGNTGWGLTHYGAVGSDIADCRFLGNGLGGAHLDAPMISNSGHSATRCTFANGDDLVGLGAAATEVWIFNCTFDDARLDFKFCWQLLVRNSIFRGGARPFDGGFSGAIAVTYSDVEGGYPGTGNIDADPLWLDVPNGDFSLLPASPCIDTGDPASLLDPDGTRADMGAIPFENAFDDLGGGVPGSAGPVTLVAHSTLVGGEGVLFKLGGTAPFQPTLLILGATQLGAPFKGGTLWPNPSALISLMTNGSGQLTLSTTWPAAIPSGFSLWAQFWHADAGAVAGFAGSNGVRGTTP